VILEAMQELVSSMAGIHSLSYPFHASAHLRACVANHAEKSA
jgi:hypothetical protein